MPNLRRRLRLREQGVLILTGFWRGDKPPEMVYANRHPRACRSGVSIAACWSTSRGAEVFS
jgi:hypothetical protein